MSGPLRDPTGVELIRNFGAAVGRWAAAGFEVTGQDEYARRRVACDACADWVGGRCRRCGCTGLKLWLATERCPAGRW